MQVFEFAAAAQTLFFAAALQIRHERGGMRTGARLLRQNLRDAESKTPDVRYQPVAFTW